MKYIVLLFVFLTSFALQSFAHDGHGTKSHGGHDPKKKKQNQAQTQADSSGHSHGGAPMAHDSAHASAPTDSVPDPSSEVPPNHAHSMDEFPTLHPLIVHFPIMFLLIAAVLQLTGFFTFRRELSWVVLGLLLVGFATAYISGRYMHPHTHGLTARAAQILKEHDLYADWTVWLSGTGLLLKGISHFAFGRKLWAEAVVSLVLVGAAYSVAMAGHHGAQLVHIEGVGPQGKFLETHDH